MRLPKGVEHWDDERECDNGIIVMLKSGYRWSIDDHGLHTRGYDTPKESREEFRYIQHCKCKLCDDGQNGGPAKVQMPKLHG